MYGQTVVGQWSRSNLVDQYRNSVLACATRWSCLLTIKLLIHRSACIYTDHNKHEDALVSAATAGNTDIVEYLLERGAKVNKPNRHGDIALVRTACCGSPETVKLLLKAGANVNQCNRHGSTALHVTRIGWGMLPCHNEIIQALLDAGADPSIQDNSGETFLFRAFPHVAHSARDDLPADHPQADIGSRGESSEMTVTDSFCSTKTLKKLIHNCQNVNVQDRHGCTILMMAVRCRRHNVVEFLLTKGTNIFLKNQDNETALTIAYELGLEIIIFMLLEAHAEYFKHYSNVPQAIVCDKEQSDKRVSDRVNKRKRKGQWVMTTKTEGKGWGC